MYKEYEEFYNKCRYALKTLETELSIIFEEYAYRNEYNPVEHIKSRIKSEKSAKDKLIKRGYEVNVDNLKNHVHDMVGLRIVCSFISDVYTVVNIIKESSRFEVINEKNYIENPKDSGYVSYHLLVLVPIYLDGKVEQVECEIQIRTLAMDFWASLDHKIRYKDMVSNPDVEQKVYQCSKAIETLDKAMEYLNELKKEESKKES